MEFKMGKVFEEVEKDSLSTMRGCQINLVFELICRLAQYLFPIKA